MPSTTLPPCRHRGRRRQRGVYDCLSTKFLGVKRVTSTDCQSCAVRDHPSEDAEEAGRRHLLPCAHFGEPIPRTPLHVCSHPAHGTATWDGCQTCPDYLFPLFIPTLSRDEVLRLVALRPADQADGWWQLPNVQAAYRLLARRFARRIPQYPGGFAGKGIVIGGGGAYLPAAYVAIRVLRHVGCTLPIELWHLAGEVNERARRRLARHGVVCIDADSMTAARPFRFLEGHWWKGWQLKPYAIAHSRFEEVLYLDADCYPTRDPADLFRSRPYRRHGAIFFPDITNSWHLLQSGAEVFGLEPARPPLESGQMLIDKRRCWRELQMTLWYNAHADYVYRHLWGDKDTFNIAWRMLGRDYGMLRHRAGWDLHTILQYDGRGTVLFQHRCRDKFRLTDEHFPANPQQGANTFNPNLALEKECFAFLRECRRDLETRS